MGIFLFFYCQLEPCKLLINIIVVFDDHLQLIQFRTQYFVLLYSCLVLKFKIPSFLNI